MASHLCRVVFPAIAVAALAAWFASSSRAADTALIAQCEQDNGDSIQQCAKTCYPLCRDNGLFSEKFRAQCTSIKIGSPDRLRDAPSCTPKLVQMPDRSYRPPEPTPTNPTLAVIGLDMTECDKADNDDIGIPGENEGKPACYISLKVTRCRVGKMVQTANALVDRYKEVIDADYGNTTFEKICAIKPAQLKKHFDLSNAVEKELSPLTGSAKAENNCLLAVDDWYKGPKSGLVNGDALTQAAQIARQKSVSDLFGQVNDAQTKLKKVESAIAAFAPIARFAKSCPPSP